VTVVDLKAETRAFSRARLRELALDAARDVVLDRGWAAVRMGAIASAVGISRQSLHGEFGTKDELGDALVMRETTTFLDGVQARLAKHPGDLAGGVADAAEFMLSATRDDPLLQTTVSFLACYAAFLAGEELHVSGVMAVVTVRRDIAVVASPNCTLSPASQTIWTSRSMTRWALSLSRSII
jgi:AcrR family transcriptional regulator